MRPTREQNVYGRTVRIETVVDLAPPDQVWTINDNTQFLETYAPLTWTGRRRYMFEDGPKWVLRRPAQVMSPGHLETLKRLTATHNHPTQRRQPVNITADNASRFAVGYTGDAIDSIEVKGYTVPASGVSVYKPPTIIDIQGGATQSSLGYVAMIDTTGGTWDGPHGPETFDFEHILDPLDPRVLELVDATKDDEQPFLASSLGGNHFAVGIRHGRGAALSELMCPVRDYATDNAALLLSTSAETLGQSPKACRVFMYRDAAGIVPEETQPEKKPVTLRKITFAADGLDVPSRILTFTDIDPELAGMIEEFMREVNASSSSLLAQINEQNAAAQTAQTEMAGAQAAQVVAEEAQAVDAAALEEVQDSLKKAEAEITELKAVLNPSDELLELRKVAARIHDADYSRLDEASVKRAAVNGKSSRDYSEAAPAVVEAVWQTFTDQLESEPARKPKPKAKAKWDLQNQPVKQERDGAQKKGGTLARINSRRASA